MNHLRFWAWVSAIIVALLAASRMFSYESDFLGTIIRDTRNEFSFGENSSQSFRQISSVTTYPAPHGAEEWNTLQKPATSPEDLLARTSPMSHAQMKSRIRQSSFHDLDANSTVYASGNGFLDAAYRAYKSHHHLVIRPEDVWFSILTQLNFYINANAEELRNLFVEHEGKRELRIHDSFNSFETADFTSLTQEMGELLGANVKDPSLEDWIMPSFSTTTDDDRVTAAVIFMSTMQEYFTYTFSFGCGLPSVTLLGNRADWEDITTRLDRLPSFGKQPAEWHTILKPVLKRFLHTFDAPDAEETKDFWQKIVHHEGGGSSPNYVSGWLTAFCFWSSDGKVLREEHNTAGVPIYTLEGPGELPPLELDGVVYHYVEDVEIGYASVPVKIEDFTTGRNFGTIMLAGSVGMKLSSSLLSAGFSLPSPGLALNTIQPVSGWFMFEKKEVASKVEIEKQVIIY